VAEKRTRARNKGRSKDQTGKKSSRRLKERKGLTFGFLMLVLFLLAGTGVFMIAMNQNAVSGDLAARHLEQRITAEKSKQKDLLISLARLKSPGRVTRMATDELGLTEPGGVIYLKYTLDASGNMVCQSTFERTSGEASQSTGKEAPSQTGKKQASIDQNASTNLTRR
jgi:cell division protein FtsL